MVFDMRENMAGGGTAVAAAGIDGVACCNRLLAKGVVVVEAH